MTTRSCAPTEDAIGTGSSHVPRRRDARQSSENDNGPAPRLRAVTCDDEVRYDGGIDDCITMHISGGDKCQARESAERTRKRRLATAAVLAMAETVGSKRAERCGLRTLPALWSCFGTFFSDVGCRRRLQLNLSTAGCALVGKLFDRQGGINGQWAFRHLDTCKIKIFPQILIFIKCGWCVYMNETFTIQLTRASEISNRA
jgi:hypothetical protein